MNIRIFILWHLVTEIVSIMRIFISELLIQEEWNLFISKSIAYNYILVINLCVW